MADKEVTFGQKAVGFTFNPSNDPNVMAIKDVFAKAIDLLATQRAVTTDPEIKRMLSIAITEAQTA